MNEQHYLDAGELAELHRAVDEARQAVALARASVELLATVVEALPRCCAEYPPGSPGAEAHPPRFATKRRAGGSMYCDEHAGPHAFDLPWAAALRALLEARPKVGG